MAFSAYRVFSASFLHSESPIPKSPSIPLHKVLTNSVRISSVYLRRNPTRSHRIRCCGSMATLEPAPKNKNLLVFESEEELSNALAKYTSDLSGKFSTERGAFTVVISGGSLVKALRKLVEAPYVDSIEWGKWHVFWVDERVVPKDHPDSNYKLAYDEFLSKEL